MEVLKLNCATCGVDYEKPIEFKLWNEEHPDVFFRWSLTYCDTCRRAKQAQALKQLPKVLKALTEKIKPTE